MRRQREALPPYSLALIILAQELRCSGWAGSSAPPRSRPPWRRPRAPVCRVRARPSRRRSLGPSPARWPTDRSALALPGIRWLVAQFRAAAPRQQRRILGAMRSPASSVVTASGATQPRRRLRGSQASARRAAGRSRAAMYCSEPPRQFLALLLQARGQQQAMAHVVGVQAHRRGGRPPSRGPSTLGLPVRGPARPSLSALRVSGAPRSLAFDRAHGLSRRIRARPQCHDRRPAWGHWPPRARAAQSAGRHVPGQVGHAEVVALSRVSMCRRRVRPRASARPRGKARTMRLVRQRRVPR